MVQARIMSEEGRALLVLANAAAKGAAVVRSPCGSMLIADAASCWEGGVVILSGGGSGGVKPDGPHAASLSPLLVVKHMAAPCPLNMSSFGGTPFGTLLYNPGLSVGEFDDGRGTAPLGQISGSSEWTSMRHLMQGAFGL